MLGKRSVQVVLLMYLFPAAVAVIGTIVMGIWFPEESKSTDRRPTSQPQTRLPRTGPAGRPQDREEIALDLDEALAAARKIEKMTSDLADEAVHRMAVKAAAHKRRVTVYVSLATVGAVAAVIGAYLLVRRRRRRSGSTRKTSGFQ